MSAFVAEITRTSARWVREEPDALVLAGLQRAQEPRLLRGRDVSDLVEEQRAAVGQLEAPRAVRLGVREGALHVPEHLALEHGLRQAARIHRDE